VVKSHGLSGEFKVEPLTDEPGRFLRLREAIIAGEVRRVLGARFANAQVLLSIEGVATVEEARLLNGEYISVPSEQAQPLEEGSYYHYQIIGLEVVTTGGEPIGVVAEVYPLPANDVYVVRGGRGEVLIPAAREIVKEIDLPASRMVVEPMPGLLPWE